MIQRPILNFRHLIQAVLLVLPILLAANEQPTLKVLAYNIKHGYGMDGKVDLSRSDFST